MTKDLYKITAKFEVDFGGRTQRYDTASEAEAAVRDHKFLVALDAMLTDERRVHSAGRLALMKADTLMTLLCQYLAGDGEPGRLTGNAPYLALEKLYEQRAVVPTEDKLMASGGTGPQEHFYIDEWDAREAAHNQKLAAAEQQVVRGRGMRGRGITDVVEAMDRPVLALTGPAVAESPSCHACGRLEGEKHLVGCQVLDR